MAVPTGSPVASPHVAEVAPRPLFGGYILVACVVAWLVGIALRQVPALVALSVGLWLTVAGMSATLWLLSTLLRIRMWRVRRGGTQSPTSRDEAWRIVGAAALLRCWLALGAARSTATDGARDPRAIVHQATNADASIRGVVAAEPDLRAGYRLLTIDVSALSRDRGQHWQPVTGRVEATVYGPDDWFAPTYGDQVTVTGKLSPLARSYAPGGAQARMSRVRVRVTTRGNGNPLLAWLFDLRIRLAQLLQHALPEPEAALLIGILLGMKTPVLRARLPRFTATGTIHLVVPAGLKVATLAELASGSLRSLLPTFVLPRTMAALLAVSLYAALGGGGPAALRAAIMGALLALTFHELSLVAPLANLVTVPLLAPLLVLGSLLALLSALGPALAGGVALLAQAVAWVTWPLLWFCDTAISLCARLPLAALTINDAPAWLAWLYYALLAATIWLLAPLLRRRAQRAGASPATAQAIVPAPHSGHVRISRGFLVATLLFATLGTCGAALPTLTDRSTHVDFLDVGAGSEAIFLRLQSGATALINGGPAGPALEAQLTGRIPLWRRSLDLALLTDPRAGDAHGLQDLAAHLRVSAAADAGMRHPTKEYLAWLDATARAGATHRLVREGNALWLSNDTVLRMLAPPQTLYPEGEGSTTASDDAVLRLETPGLRVLLLGAADDYALDALAYAKQPLDADVVEVALPTDAPLDLTGPLGAVLTAAHPHIIIVSSAPIPPTSLAARRAADPDVMALDSETGASLGATIYRLSAVGTVSLSGDANGWALG